MRFRRRHTTERGASLVEAAILVPVLAFLTFAAIDGSLYFESYLSIGYTAKAGVRTGTAQANQADADYQILQAINKSRVGVGAGTIERIVVFKAASFDDPVPAECMTSTTGGIEGLCNVYTECDLSRPVTDFGDGTSFTADQHWPAWLRVVSRSSTPDLVGVAIEARASMPTGVLGRTSSDVTRLSIMQIEARSI